MILSVSRRTDIPAFYTDWFFDRLKEGFVLVPNPINQNKIAKIKLEPIKIKNVQLDLLGNKIIETTGNVEGIVFWTKNPSPILEKIEFLKDFKYYCLYTLNAYPSNIEANLPSVEDRIESFKKLSTFCPVIWRYDPILLTERIDVNWHIKNFENLCQKLQGYTKICKTSFVIESYKGCSSSVHAPNIEQKQILMENLSKIAQKYNIKLEACAENGDWSKYGVYPSKCIDGEIFEKLLTEKFFNQHIVVKRKNNKIDGQRKNCGCMPAIDIGRYDTCKHGCNYCYAHKGSQKSMLDTPKGEIYERKTELEFEYK